MKEKEENKQEERLEGQQAKPKSQSKLTKIIPVNVTGAKNTKIVCTASKQFNNSITNKDFLA